MRPSFTIDRVCSLGPRCKQLNRKGFTCCNVFYSYDVFRSECISELATSNLNLNQVLS